MKELGLVAALALAGCGPDMEADKAALAQYRHQPIQAVTARLGYPQAETTVMGRKAYVWSSTTQQTFTAPIVTTAVIGSTPVLATTYGSETSTASCTLRVFVDARDRIDGFDVKGEAGACSPYVRRLK